MPGKAEIELESKTAKEPCALHRGASRSSCRSLTPVKNLLTKNATRNGSEIQARDIQTFRIINDWLQDPRFKSVASQLNTIRLRLEAFLAKPAP